MNNEKPVTKASETARLKRMIKKGVLPKTHFVRTEKGKLERSATPRTFITKKGKLRTKYALTWKTQDTIKKLTEGLK